MNYTIKPDSKLEEEKPFTCEDVAENLIVDGIDDEGYIKLHSSRRIRHNISEQHFYKIHADEVNKIIEMAAGYKKTSSAIDELSYIVKYACANDCITSICVTLHFKELDCRKVRIFNKAEREKGDEIGFLASLANDCKGYHISKKEINGGNVKIYLDEN